MPTYEQVLESQSSSHYTQFWVAAVFCAATLTSPPQPAQGGQQQVVHAEAVPDDVVNSQAERIIARINELSQNEALRDEDELAPTQNVINQATQLVREAEELMVAPMPPGQVTTFFGEINVTWRVGDRIVRFACFPSRPSLIQTGSLSMPIGSYRSEPNATAQRLAQEIDSFIPQHDPEEPVFG